MRTLFSEKFFLLHLALWTAALFSSPYGFAYEKGDFLVKAGAAVINPREDSDSIDLSGVKLGKIGVKSQTVPIVNISYFATDKLAFELLLSTPPVFEIVGTTGLVSGVPIGEIEAYPLVIIAQYFPMEPQSRWQPFVGLGFNYVVAGDIDIDPDLAPSFGARDIELDVDDSFGVTLSLGLDFKVSESIFLSAEAHYVDIKANGSGKVIIGDQKLDLNLFAQTGYAPVFYSFTLGYVF